jgi:integrase/recombinase XerD
VMVGRIIRFLAETGQRQEEACGLERSQVSIQRRAIRLTTTKTSSPRVVLLSDLAIDTLTGTPRHITSPYVFRYHDGQRYTCFAGVFRKIARRACDPPVRRSSPPHFASLFAQSTGDLAVLQATLGHNTIVMTIRYSHLMTNHLHSAMSKSGVLTGTKPGTGPAALTS